MTDKKKSTSDPFDPPPQDQDRTTATIDLKATELKSEKETEKQNTEEKTSKPKEDQTNSDRDIPPKKGIFHHLGLHMIKNIPFKNLSNHATTAIIGIVIAIIVYSLISLFNTDNTTEDLTARLNKIEKNIDLISKISKSEDGNNLGQTAHITKVITDFENNLETRLKQLKTEFASHNEQTSKELIVENNKRIAEHIDRLQGSINELTVTLKKIQQQTTELRTAYETLNQQNTARDRTVLSLNNELNTLRRSSQKQNKVTDVIKPMSERISDLEQSLSQVSKDSKQKRQDTQRAALIIAMTNLKRSIDRGERFDAELETVRRLSPVSLPFTDLDRHSESGVPIQSELERQFPKVLREALDASKEREDETMWQKIVSNATSIVRIRRTGEITGNTPEAILARMEVRVKKGDLAEALNESKALKGSALRTARPWLEQVQARLHVEEALQNVEIELLSELGRRPRTNRHQKSKLQPKLFGQEQTPSQ